MGEHFKRCEYIVEKCLHSTHTGFSDGNQDMRRKELTKHHSRACESFPLPCEFCEKLFARKTLRHHRWVDCDLYPEYCRHCDSTIERKSIRKHESQECGMRLILCETCPMKVPF
jgi:hypothetical protein